ncbi:UNVERIFIED_CONTAM: hypothetical protein Slati_1107900 [Sesamum latifolium]|uniref:Uncharacterized protein n=1 Tax=Sesamum latifolium TaxID=2727402 RepID=A0AAW2XBY7_9LAMI
MLNIKQILKVFEVASGLQINMEKSAITFSRNTLTELKIELANILGVEVVDKHTKYLGLPSTLGRSKRAVFEELKRDSGKNRTVGLLRSFHKLDMRDLEGMMVIFFWQDGGQAKIHWVAWHKICRRRSYSPSYTWRSILQTRDLFAADLRWSIGNGETVSIMGVPWIPRPLSFQIICPPLSLGGHTKVAELLDEKAGMRSESGKSALRLTTTVF